MHRFNYKPKYKLKTSSHNGMLKSGSKFILKTLSRNGILKSGSKSTLKTSSRNGIWKPGSKSTLKKSSRNIILKSGSKSFERNITVLFQAYHIHTSRCILVKNNSLRKKEAPTLLV